MAPSTMVVDLRSDTVTRPCARMREAMSSAAVGDDVRGDDPTVSGLQRRVAGTLGKEAGLFLPSGTMANLVAVLSHCWERSSEVLLGDASHIHIYEQGAISQFGGVHARPVANLPDGTFSLSEAASKVRGRDPQGHFPTTRLVCVENTHCAKGGKALPQDWLQELFSLCVSLGLRLHCDGARLFNAAAALGVNPASLVSGCDSVSVCMSKGLGCPVGSVLVGSREFIQRAHLLRKGLGGGMRQAGVLAAAAEFALDHNLPRLLDDHAHARRIARVFSDLGGGLFVPDVGPATTNLVVVAIADVDVVTPDEFLEMIQQPDERCDVSVPGVKFSPTTFRLALHLDVGEAEVAAAERKIAAALEGVIKDREEKAAALLPSGE